MISQQTLALVGGLLLTLAAVPAWAQTALPGGFEITLLPGYAYEPKQGFDSVVGVIEKKGGLKINFEMGNVPPPGAPVFGGSLVNQALRVRENDRQWLKETTIGGRQIFVAHGKNDHLVVTSTTAKEGINFHTEAKTPADIAEVLLMTLSFREGKGK
ncbi:hypothetical protein ETAA8_54630 [Anatilimnocola aggregata]|uniref:Uncharacterized protein n=1 Tax=Anatilimnocola aggregata TaxID=2528021 RepID=A0A517YJE8_9BACT|nr:hypothetical protein [Anatilimnocola aggregata]QDU30335.1 hypothetical protein ETAA8_54630 [Anatilimnocola aggregata]